MGHHYDGLTDMSSEDINDARDNTGHHRLLCLATWWMSHPGASFPFCQFVGILPGEISSGAILPLAEVHLAQCIACADLPVEGKGHGCSSLLSTLLWTAIKGIDMLAL